MEGGPVFRQASCPKAVPPMAHGVGIEPTARSFGGCYAPWRTVYVGRTGKARPGWDHDSVFKIAVPT